MRGWPALGLALAACAGPVEYACSATWDAGATSESWGEGSMSCRLFQQDALTVIATEESRCEAEMGERDGVAATCRCVLGDRNGCE